MDKQITQFRGKYAFLSNFYNTEFIYKNEKFSNSEQAFHWEFVVVLNVELLTMERIILVKY